MSRLNTKLCEECGFQTIKNDFYDAYMCEKRGCATNTKAFEEHILNVTNDKKLDDIYELIHDMVINPADWLETIGGVIEHNQSLRR